ncbi:alginate export family protein [Sphingobium aquiterrae]|uniref:alginate export family protein n=1 Tax=Sphingobium aquiterrae TaxID=2038656 RepID=UPI003015E92B
MRALPLLLATGVALAATPAAAQTITLKPIVDARLRYEGVDQDGIARNADALTARIRSGIEATSGPWAFLAEAQATLAISENYNSTVNGKTLYPTVPDPENIALSRIQLQYKGLPRTVVTLGRQRINLDDQRFVGSVAWRQNEQTFDAVRVESAALGPLSVDLTYSWSDRTIFGIDSPIQAIGGDNLFAGVGLKLGPISAKGFAYLVDQDISTRRQFSSQTYGLRAVGTFPLGKGAKLSVTGSYARQSDYAGNPNDYAADYYLGEAALAAKGLTLTGGYEVLGASTGAANSSFQTPLATLHKFQGWADKFLVTPANGIRDLYASAGYALPKTPAGPVSLLVAWHRFDSDRLSIDYGHEWDAQVGFKPARHVALLVKFADYQADRFATDTQKLWLQLDYTL